jgi:hypothetical protein
MIDYKELYLKMFRASEEAINILIAAQKECEESCISSPEPEIQIISFHTGNSKDVDEEYF